MFSKDADEIIAEIKMEKAVYKGGFLLVEGDDDVGFWELRLIDSINNNRVKLIKADGKFNAVNAAKLLDTENEQRTIGVVDADFDHALNISLETKRLIFTDDTDLEMMLINSSALIKLLLQNKECLEYLNNKYDECLLNLAFNYGVRFGCVRIFNVKHDYSFKFNAVETHYCQHVTIVKNKKLITIKTILNLIELEEKLHDEFFAAISISKTQLVEHIKSIENLDKAKVSRGKDMIEIIFLLMRESNCGIKNKADLFDRLNLAFEMTDLYKTQMFQSLKQLDTAWNLNMLSDYA
jgi:hypothetical protein